jgi:hypothetical protein
LASHGNIAVRRNFNTDTMFFADDQIFLSKSEDDLQYSVHKLKNVVEEPSMEMNTWKTKVMTFRGKEPMTSKICINIRILEHVNIFNYLACNICYEGEKYLNVRITNSVKVVEIINQIFKPALVSRHTRIQIYKILARPTLFYGSEAWKIRKMM